MSGQDDLSRRRSQLSPEKQALLQTWLRQGPGLAAPVQTILPSPNHDPVPLSFSQQRLWLIDQLDPGRPVYNIPLGYWISGRLNVAALEQSLTEIVRRHRVLRTAFPSVDGKPAQVVAPDVNLRLESVDLRGIPGADRAAEAQRLATKEAQRPFDLSRGPLLRATLLVLGDEEHLLLLVMHHIISDGWSIGVMSRELAALYEAISSGKPSPLPELPIQYGDFAQWQRQSLQGEALESLLGYWRQQLSDRPSLLELPTSRLRPAVQSYRGASRWFTLPTGLTEELKALSRREDVTPFMTLLAAFYTLLYRYTLQEDLLVGSPIAGRRQVETEGLIGFLVNTLVLRADLSGNPTFRQLLHRVREVTLAAYAHQDLPFEKLVEELQPERDLSHNPVFQVMFVLQNAPLPPLHLPGLTLSPVEVERGAAVFDLTLELRENSQGLYGRFEYSTDLFDAETIGRMTSHFQTLLASIVADPKKNVGTLALLTESERRQLLVEWNDTQAAYPEGACIHQVFEAQVQRTPDATAVVFEGEELTYRELNLRGNQLAHHLGALGVGPGSVVGICVERSLEMVVGLLGILKAGGAYLPLDPAYPKDRLAFILEDAQVPVLLTQQRLAKELPKHAAGVVYLDAASAQIAQQSKENPINSVTPRHPAYIIYTSGSTGMPKGAILEHRGLCNVAAAQVQVFGVGPGSRVLQFSSLNFDASIFEIVLALCSGATLCVGRRETLLPGPALARFLRDQDITIVVLPPSVLAAVPQGEYPALKTVTAAGEACPAELVDRWAPGRRFFNLYGPTEATIWSSFAECAAGQGRPDIGRPIGNAQVYVLDPHLHPVPIGVPGELHLGGIGLATGYLNRPQLTAEKFIPHPFSEEPGARLYKTGDLVRYRPNGNIEFLGRIDSQVKIRGFRIELGEIEEVLRSHPMVHEAVVLAREETPGDKRLTAYVVPGQKPAPRPGELLQYLREKLPDYMVPAACTILDALPLNPHGKLDRQALPVPSSLRPELATAYQAPTTQVQQHIAQVWQEALGLEKVGVEDNFFDLGGHSLALAKVQGDLEGLLGREVPLLEMFRHPTVGALARYLEEELEPGSDFEEGQRRGAARAKLMQERSRPRVYGVRGTHPHNSEGRSTPHLPAPSA